jgi:hypothetical protein
VQIWVKFTLKKLRFTLKKLRFTFTEVFRGEKEFLRGGKRIHLDFLAFENAMLNLSKPTFVIFVEKPTSLEL